MPEQPGDQAQSPPCSFRSSKPGTKSRSRASTPALPGTEELPALPDGLSELRGAEGFPSQVDRLEEEFVKTLTEKQLAEYKEAKSLEHQMTHEPMNDYCYECHRAKKMRKQARSAKARGADVGHKPEKHNPDLPVSEIAKLIGAEWRERDQ